MNANQTSAILKKISALKSQGRVSADQAREIFNTAKAKAQNLPAAKFDAWLNDLGKDAQPFSRENYGDYMQTMLTRYAARSAQPRFVMYL